MKIHTYLGALCLTIAITGCATCPTNCKTTCCPGPAGPTPTSVKPGIKIPKPSGGAIGSWYGSSYGESIILKIGSNGSAILNNDAGSNSGSWASQGSGSYSVNIAGQSGRMVLLNPSTASLNIGGSSIELRRN
jgi:hypothetical protein